jgi:hypothetical protein
MKIYGMPNGGCPAFQIPSRTWCPSANVGFIHTHTHTHTHTFWAREIHCGTCHTTCCILGVITMWHVPYGWCIPFTFHPILSPSCVSVAYLFHSLVSLTQ